MNIVLHEPEIHMNTGNIGRTCVAADAALHLIHPLGFSLNDKAVKRAGLDYWQSLRLFEYTSFDDFIKSRLPGAVYLASTKGTRLYSEINYSKGDYIVFGKESAGLPESIRRTYSEGVIRIPMSPENRSLNLANAVAVVLYEALRQTGFPGLK